MRLDVGGSRGFGPGCAYRLHQRLRQRGCRSPEGAVAPVAAIVPLRGYKFHRRGLFQPNHLFTPYFCLLEVVLIIYLVYSDICLYICKETTFRRRCRGRASYFQIAGRKSGQAADVAENKRPYVLLRKSVRPVSGPGMGIAARMQAGRPRSITLIICSTHQSGNVS